MPTKRGPLGRAEQFYIEQNPDKKSEYELAVELGRNVAQIRKALQKYAKELEKKSTSVTTVRTNTMMDELIGKKKRNDQTVAVVMTEAASQYGDATRDSNVKTSTKTQNAVFRPRG